MKGCFSAPAIEATGTMDDRSAGLRVNKASHGMATGMRANISGTVRTNADGERYIDTNSVKQNGAGYAIPLGMTVRDLGGRNWQYSITGTAGQAGVTYGRGLNNIGLFATICGTVTCSDIRYFYLDDGSGITDDSGNTGIKVLTNGFASPGSYKE